MADVAAAGRVVGDVTFAPGGTADLETQVELAPAEPRS
jgi:hypothetical protein